MKKKILISILSILSILMLLVPISVYADYESEVTFKYNKEEQKVLDNVPKIGCKAAYIVEPNTGKVIYEKNAHEKMYPASTTKILTALVVLEKCKLTDKAVVSKKAIDLVPEGYSNPVLKVGEELSISDLLCALLIPSSNEAANVLAEHVSGNIEDFAKLCNNRAKELGCENLHFVNPNGIHDSNHYCTAYDLYLIAKECRKYDIFNDIVKRTSFTLPATNIYPRNDRILKNTNYLILPNSSSYYYQYCTGIKTGHTTPAGECLVASSLKDNIDLISVVLGGGTNSKGLNERFYDTKQLFEFVYNNYSLNKIANKDYVVKTIDISNATKETASLDLVIKTDISTIVPNNIDTKNIEKTISIDDNIVAPIEENQVLGQITFHADGLNYTVDIVASHDVEKLPYWLYNTIAVGVAILVLIIFISTIKHFKRKHKKTYYSK